MRLWRFLAEKRAALFYIGLCAACCALVFWTYHLAAEAVFYALLLCGAIGLAFALAGALTHAKKRRLLRNYRNNVAAGEQPLPRAGSALEAEYQALVRALSAQSVRESARNEQCVRDMRDDYTLWAHQIKTPIAAMRLLLDELDGEEARELSLELMRVEEYVAAALTLQHLSGDGNDFVLREYALDDIVKKAVRKYSRVFIRRKVRLVYVPLNASALTDEKWLLFIIEQLLSNAVKYTPAGGRVEISLEAPKTLVITDTGIGIAPEDLPRVCERGYTGFNGREERRSTGIGLYLCKRLTALLGHTLTIQSEVGKGTQVKIGLESAALHFE